jgi:thymidylate synthase
LSAKERLDLLLECQIKYRGGLSGMSGPDPDVIADFYNKEFIKFNIPTRAISLMWNQRSVDFGLGAPFNIASYGLLLGIIAKEVNMVPDELIGNLGDVHLYLDHIEPIKEQLNREPYPLPTLKIEPEVKWNEGDCLPYYSPQDFTLENYQSHPTINLSLSN